MWRLWCQAWSVRPDGPKGPAAIRAIRTMDTRHPCQGIGHYWIDRIDGLLHKSLGQLHLFGTHRFGDTKPCNLLEVRRCFCLKRIWEFRFCKSLVLRFSEGRVPYCPPTLTPLWGTGNTVLFTECPFLQSRSIPVFGCLCHVCPILPQQSAQRGRQPWKSGMQSNVLNDIWLHECFNKWSMKRLREQCANLLSRNKWTRNSSVTTHKSSSMTPFLIQYRGMTCHVKCHDLPITQPSFLDFAISKAVRNSCSSPIFIFEKSASMALRAWVRSRASSWAV